MPERMSFACFYERPRFNGPRLPMGRVAELVGSKVGAPVEAMLLDYETGQTRTEPFPLAHRMLDYMPGPTELLSVYAVPGDGSPGRSCVGLHARPEAVVVTASLPDMSVAADAELVAGICTRLHAAGAEMAQCCVVAAGGECGFDADLPTAAAALAAACATDSLAAWVACDAEAFSELPDGYVLVRRNAPNTVLMRQRRTTLLG
jgi:hypothetical protein